MLKIHNFNITCHWSWSLVMSDLRHCSLYPVLSWATAPASVLLSGEDGVRSGMSDLQLARPLAMKVRREATLAIRQQENMNRENW